MRAFLTTALLATLALAGCLDDDSNNGDDPAGPGKFTSFGGGGTIPPSAVAQLNLNHAPTWSAPLLIDETRAGGEPVIAILQSGTILVSAHPGWTHYHPGQPGESGNLGEELIVPANAQSYMWRSTDGGETWDHVDLLTGIDNAPRSTALGVSDPEFTVMEDGTVCMTDLIALASSSTSCSSDDGVTWTPGNSLASGGVNDRQWLASIGDEFYFTAAYFASTTGAPDHHIRASTDYGLTWEDRGDVPCSQDLIGNPHTDHLVVACGPGVSVSEDRGFTWTPRGERQVDLEALGIPGGSPRMAEPAIDAAGNTWVTWVAGGERRLFVAGSPDEGINWPWVYEVTPHFRQFSVDRAHDSLLEEADDGLAGTNGTYIWPWISAGSDGRLAVTWIGQYGTTPSPESYGPYYIFTAYFVDATTSAPQVHVDTLTPAPIHLNPICQSGTTCQVTSVLGDPSGDRRLGDFFETTIDAEGFLHGAWSNTAEASDDVISHPQYVRQLGGVRLLAEADIGVYVPTQG